MRPNPVSAGGDTLLELLQFLACPLHRLFTLRLLVAAALVGIDSVNIDSLRDKRRPVHTILLGRQIPIVEHLCNLGSINTDVRFFAAPVAVRGIGTFPTRAYAIEC